MQINECRLCQHKLTLLFNIGKIPLVNYYPKNKGKKEKLYPLNLTLCPNCGLFQVDEEIKIETLFKEYYYSTSASSPLVKHLNDLANSTIRKFNLTPKSKILDIGSNDGTFLKPFKDKGFTILGVDPAKDIKPMIGIKTLPKFFTQKTAQEIQNEFGQFDLISATNVLAQNANLRGFLNGVKKLLNKQGVFLVEVISFKEMLVTNGLDQIYHEHIFYFTLKPLLLALEQSALKAISIQKDSIHGGSYRLYITHQDNTNYQSEPRIKKLIRSESGLYLVAKYHKIISRWERTNKQLLALLKKLKKKDKKIVGFASPAKAVVLLNYSKIDNSLINYIVDSTPYKQNHYLPGLKIPIKDPAVIFSDPIDYILLLAWNYEKDILKILSPLRKKGVKIILVHPNIRII